MNRLDQIRKRVDDASPGPWELVEFTNGYGEVERYVGIRWDELMGMWEEGADGLSHENAVLVAHAPEDIAFLLSEVERLSR